MTGDHQTQTSFPLEKHWQKNNSILTRLLFIYLQTLYYFMQLVEMILKLQSVNKAYLVMHYFHFVKTQIFRNGTTENFNTITLPEINVVICHTLWSGIILILAIPELFQY